MKEAIKTYLPFIAGLICFFLYLNKCQKQAIYNNTIVKKDSTIVYLKDTGTHVHKTVNVYSNPIFTVNPTQKVDTALIIKKYFTKYYLSDTIKDTLINMVVNDTLFNNKITFRKYEYKLVKPYQVIKTYTITETKTIDKNTGFFVGFFVEAGNKIYGTGPQANLVLKKSNIGVGFNILNRSGLIQYTHKIGK